jgi:hypothetical protein
MSNDSRGNGANSGGSNSGRDRMAELRQIVEALFEERASAAEIARLDQLVIADSACRKFYLESIDLHGNLYWDAAQAGAEPVPVATPIPERPSRRRRDSLESLIDAPLRPDLRPDRRAAASGRARLRWMWAGVAAVAVALIAALAAWPTNAVRPPAPGTPNLASGEQASPVERPSVESPAVADKHALRPDSTDVARNELPPATVRPGEGRSVEGRTTDVRPQMSQRDARPAVERSLDVPSPDRRPAASAPVATSNPLTTDHTDAAPPTPRRTAATEHLVGADRGLATDHPSARDLPTDTNTHVGGAADHADDPKDVVAFVDLRLKKGWKTAGIKPSPPASDAEWLRRVYLDLSGHIPPETAVDEFLDGAAKRSDVVGQLLKQPDFARNWATIWANLLVGRQPRAPGVSRDMLEKFLRDSFAANTPWNEVVYELVSAEGTPEHNPATNFLLAHLNNDAVPATAMTARLLLGIQVQCTQCHDHPFQSEKQNRFWELKSFFQQTEMTSVPGSAMGSATADGSAGMSAVPELVSRKVGGPVYYETRRGEMRVAYPIYAGHKIDPGPSVNRRRELARLIAKEDDRQVALAFVNRTWQHFFGYGFTRPVDDMGPHNPPSNPEVLERLADEFIASGYDLRQLCRWIVSTDAYQRTSVLRPENRSDDPANGAPAGFSRVYLKAMTAEELYDSLLLATRAKSSARTDWNDAGRRRQDWVRQFVMSYGTDENDEATVPAGSISQALVMMNDSIVRSALAVEPGTLLGDVVRARVSDSTKIRRLCRSALSRDPRPAEVNAALEQLKAEVSEAETEKARQLAEARALQDIFWAFLNANEFAFVH